MLTVTVIDEWSPGKVAPEWALDLLRERITARELIRRRIHQEVMDYNARMPGRFHSLVQPSDSERVLNGYHLQDGRTIDWRAQSVQAQEAFQRHRFILLVDDHQVEDLDEEIALRAGAEVMFLRLTPLAGG
jgi:hypothetical protein